MRSQSFDNLPNHFKTRLFDSSNIVHYSINENRNNNGTYFFLLILWLSYNSSNSLHNINFRTRGSIKAMPSKDGTSTPSDRHLTLPTKAQPSDVSLS